jgi:hypothetical protein
MPAQEPPPHPSRARLEGVATDAARQTAAGDFLVKLDHPVWKKVRLSPSEKCPTNFRVMIMWGTVSQRCAGWVYKHGTYKWTTDNGPKEFRTKRDAALYVLDSGYFRGLLSAISFASNFVSRAPRSAASATNGPVATRTGAHAGVL